MPLTFYDIPSTTTKSWSPNTLKTRICLNYKGLDYKTQWVEYPDIAAVCQEKGIPPTIKPQGHLYTLPAIHDTSDDPSHPPVALSESYDIAKYLDSAYPDESKRLIPAGEDAELFQQKFALSVRDLTIVPLGLTFFPRASKVLNPRSKEYFDRTKAVQYFKIYSHLDEIKVTDEEVANMWAASRDGWTKLDEQYQKTDDKGPWLLGEKPSFGDFVVLAALICMKQVYGEESEEWKMIRTWNGGRWGKLYDDTAYLRDSEI